MKKRIIAVLKRPEFTQCKLKEINDVFKFKPEDNPFKIGDIALYKNTKGNIKEAKIISFEVVDRGDTWFHGINIITNAKVWAPLHLSLKYKSEKR